MPRPARAAHGDVVYHVLNRGNDRRIVFPAEADYAEFAKLLEQHCAETGMRLLGWCAMPNHIHLALWPRADGELGRFMQRLTTSHVRRHHRRHGGSGHLWQDRYKAFPVQQDGHLLTVLRYVERNPVRAALAASAADWRWSSCPSRLHGGGPPLTASPTPLPKGWARWVDEPLTSAELEQVRLNVNRGAPYGGEAWRNAVAAQHGRAPHTRRPGRPRKETYEE